MIEGVSKASVEGANKTTASGYGKFSVVLLSDCRYGIIFYEFSKARECQDMSR